MFKFFKNKSKSEAKPESEAQTPEKEGDAFKNALLANTVERRRYVRVRYTPVGAIGDLPSIQWEGQYLEILNLSQGGLLILSPPMGKALTGQVFNFRLHWPRRRLELWNKAELLRVNQKHWHFRFTDVDARFFAQLPGLVKTGVRAQKTSMLKEYEIPSGENIVEVWMSMLGDFVMFQAPPSGPHEIITMAYDGNRYRFDAQKGLVTHKKTAGSIEENPVPQSQIDTVLIYLSNLGRSTPRLQKLISAIVDYHYRSSNQKAS